MLLVPISDGIGLRGRLSLPLHVTGRGQPEGEQQEGVHGAGRRRRRLPTSDEALKLSAELSPPLAFIHCSRVVGSPSTSSWRGHATTTTRTLLPAPGAIPATPNTPMGPVLAPPWP